jgi:hypothetical protein
MKDEKISEINTKVQDNDVVDSMVMEPNTKIEVELTEEEKLRLEEVKELVQAESLDVTTSMNIIINAVQVAFDTDIYNDLDKYLIAKSLKCFKSYVDKGEDIVLKVQP